jgi:hypothetical protein
MCLLRGFSDISLICSVKKLSTISESELNIFSDFSDSKSQSKKQSPVHIWSSLVEKSYPQYGIAEKKSSYLSQF